MFKYKSEDEYYWNGLLNPSDQAQCLSYGFKDKIYSIVHSLIKGNVWKLCIRYRKGGKYMERKITQDKAFTIFNILNERIKKEKINDY